MVCEGDHTSSCEHLTSTFNNYRLQVFSLSARISLGVHACKHSEPKILEELPPSGALNGATWTSLVCWSASMMMIRKPRSHLGSAPRMVITTDSRASKTRNDFRGLACVHKQTQCFVHCTQFKIAKVKSAAI